MIIFNHFTNLRSYLEKCWQSKKKIGFVPTMGALHHGHFSLIRESQKHAGITVCSIFVNPLQFDNSDDFKKYPKTTEEDILALEELGCDVLLLPDFEEVFPDEASENKYFGLGYLENILEGKFRPGHFQGVCMVVERLLNEICPYTIFIGQKDFQQCMVIKKLIELMSIKIELVISPTLRENSGLAMSSRNMRLNAEEKKIAEKLFQSLQFIQSNLDVNNFLQLRDRAIHNLSNDGFNVEYLELAKTDNLELVSQYNSQIAHVILIAAYLNDVRLIDNILTEATSM